MARFPLLDSEQIIQVSDKIRLDASKSFVSGETAITALEIKPLASGTLISVFNANPALRFLDWAYDFTVDVVAASNDTIIVNEGMGPLTATVVAGNYTLAALSTAIKTALDLASPLTYTVAALDDSITIYTSATFSITGGTLLTHIGFTGEETGALTYTGSEIEVVYKEISTKLTTLSGNSTSTNTISVISSSADALWSNDNDLITHESEVYNLLKQGKSSFKNFHRRAQSMMLDWFNRQGYVDFYGDKFTKASFVDSSEVKEWSTFQTLCLIYEGVSNATDDIFHEKAIRYSEKLEKSRDRAVLRLDLDKDGVLSKYEQTETRSGLVVRR